MDTGPLREREQGGATLPGPQTGRGPQLEAPSKSGGVQGINGCI